MRAKNLIASFLDRSFVFIVLKIKQIEFIKKSHFFFRNEIFKLKIGRFLFYFFRESDNVTVQIGKITNTVAPISIFDATYNFRSGL